MRRPLESPPTRERHSSSTARRRSSISSTPNPARDAIVAAVNRAKTTRSARTGSDSWTTSLTRLPRRDADRCWTCGSSGGGLRDDRVDREDLRQTRDLEHLEDPRFGDDEAEVAASLAAALEHPDEDAQRRRVEEAYVQEVDDDRRASRGHQRLEVLAQSGCRRHIDLAGHRDHRDSVDRLLGNVEGLIHALAPLLAQGTRRRDATPPSVAMGRPLPIMPGPSCRKPGFVTSLRSTGLVAVVVPAGRACTPHTRAVV